MKLSLISVALMSVVTILISCSDSNSGGAGMPLIEPPVTAATPNGLKARSDGARTLPIADVKSRFFAAGPTYITNLLQSIDTRISEINTRSSETARTCLSATPVAYNLTINGETLTGYFQCYDLFEAGVSGMLFGQKDGVWYLYQNVGQGRSYAVVSPVEGQTGKYQIKAWMSVGQLNATGTGCSSNWYGCSYGSIRLEANSYTNTFEMSVAGTGFGFCGAHLKSDGTNLYVVGSAGATSDGTTWTCAASDSVCTLAADTDTAGTCTSVNDDDFVFDTLGITGESTVGTGITTDGTGTDSVHFGPSATEMAAIEGVSAF